MSLDGRGWLMQNKSKGEGGDTGHEQGFGNGSAVVVLRDGAGHRARKIYR
jgi:hypothetical protein